MTEAEVMDLTVACRTFPETPEAEVHRENLLDTIDNIFIGETRLIVVEGLEGIGKTNLLSQFARHHPHHVLSLFIKPSSRLAYAPDYLKLVLSEQLHWALHHEVMNAETVDEGVLRTQLISLQKRAHRNRESYYFLVDGLGDIPPEDSQFQESILKDILPLGLSGFYFLVSGDLHLLSGNLHRLVRAKSFPVPTFSFDETMKYFSDVNIPRESVEDVYKMCRGLPGNLAIVRRMLQSGTSVQSLLEEEPSRLPDFLAIEWREVNANNIADRKLLAVIAYSRSVYSVEDLARILDRDSSNVHLYLKSLGIITIDNESGEVSFVSEAHRRYVATQLNDLKEEANNILIDDLLKDKTSEAALSHLPTYYQQAGRLTELLGYLTPEYFANLIDHSQSLSPLYQKADVGLQTAETLRQNEALMRFGIQKSVLDELTRVVAWQSEIEARMRLRDFATATALAQSSVLKEDRLHLLATINRIRREDGLLPERELTEQIELLCDQIDPATLGERATEIACDLVYTDADLAIRMVEEATKSREESDAIDWAFAKLSITALASSGSKTGIAEMVEKARSKISNLASACARISCNRT
jgi:hypothetical protein